jgi:hypothetical protein
MDEDPWPDSRPPRHFLLRRRRFAGLIPPHLFQVRALSWIKKETEEGETVREGLRVPVILE